MITVGENTQHHGKTTLKNFRKQGNEDIDARS